ncbi:hypothetical protein E1301_Tti005895 [Triplophysa tibetana]|uniref:Uncharacterized protein n=1 Tax=Triplophysa tibetana TaxID=1572043 RepID=A0A5A9PTE0_9TELE|nr:hypothetical protein E1301_Tti005895 [Triplophysa tibetana]
MTVVNHLDVVLISEVQSPAEEKMEEITTERCVLEVYLMEFMCLGTAEQLQSAVRFLSQPTGYFKRPGQIPVRSSERWTNAPVVAH